MRDGDTVVAATLFLHDDRSSYYLFGATDPAFRRTGAGTFVLLKMIERSLAAGTKEVDVVGVNSPNRGDFKTSFNARIEPFFICSFGQQP